MSESIGDAFVEIGAKTGGFFSAMSDVEKKFAGTATGLQGQAFALASKLGIIAGATAGVAKVLTSAAEWEQETMDLAIAIKVAGGNVEDMIPKLEEYAEAIARTTTYEDGAVKGAMAMGLQIGIQKDRIEEASKAAVGLSTKYNIDLSTAMQQIGRVAVGGSARFLSMYGIIDKTSTSTEQFEQALRKGIDAFGIAEAKASTMEGGWKRLGNATAEAAEGVGKLLSDFISLPAIIDGASKAMGWFADISKEATKSPTWDIFASTLRASWQQVMGDREGALKSVARVEKLWNGEQVDAVGDLTAVKEDANRKLIEDEKEKHAQFSSLLNAWKVQQEMANKVVAKESNELQSHEEVPQPMSAEYEEGDRFRLAGGDMSAEYKDDDRFSLANASGGTKTFAGITMRDDTKSGPLVGDGSFMDSIKNVFNYEAHGKENPVDQIKRGIDALIDWLNINGNGKKQDTAPIIY